MQFPPQQIYHLSKKRKFFFNETNCEILIVVVVSASSSNTNDIVYQSQPRRILLTLIFSRDSVTLFINLYLMFCLRFSHSTNHPLAFYEFAHTSSPLCCPNGWRCTRPCKPLLLSDSIARKCDHPTIDGFDVEETHQHHMQPRSTSLLLYYLLSLMDSMARSYARTICNQALPPSPL